MMWIAFGVGLVVGTSIGILMMGLLQMAREGARTQAAKHE